MPRRSRLILPEVPLHIIQRGNNRQACFFADDDYQCYLEWLEKYAKETGCDIHSYVLMTNHVATTLLTGAMAAFEAMNIKKIALGTAYTDDINALEAEYFAERGIDCITVKGMSLMTDTQMNLVTPECLLEFAKFVDHPEADAVFLSCGALRSIDILDQAEQKLGKPVLSSSQVSMWHCLRLARINDKINGVGQLLREY